MLDILLGDQTFTYTIEKKRIKNLNLRLVSANSFRISSPFLVSHRLIEKFIRDNQLWILLHSQKFKPEKDLLDLKELSILGEIYQVFIIKSLKDKVTFNHSARQIILKTRILSSSHLRLVINKFLKPFALKLIEKEIKFFQNQYNFKFSKVSIRTQKTRFGSCSSSGNLSFNWQIILFPYDKFQHVILHELAHLTHHNHSSRFWALLGEYDPNCYQNKLWIRREAKNYLLF